jgi:general secretion pathway protein B
MSFILDALKKSEAERQNQAGAGISNTPRARHNNQLPAWAMGLMAALVLAVIGLGWAWWQAQRSPPAVANRPAATTPAAARASGPVRNLAAEARPSEDAAAAAQAGTPQAAPPASATSPGAPGDQPPVPVKVAPAPTATAMLPTTADLTSQGITLPDMNLDIHVFSSNKSERFVFINGGKYREGDRLRDGPRVEEITADGVILRHQGASFLLPRD